MGIVTTQSGSQSLDVRGDIRSDQLMKENIPNRVFYATGILLAEDDFRAEQQYHRGRLARALNYLHGSGTVAGLRVNYQPKVEATSTVKGRDEEIIVEPGLAIDRLGRLIEVSTSRCIRLERWYLTQSPDTIKKAFRADFATRNKDGQSITVSGMVVDVFARFIVCEQGKTPAFAKGPFDALDAVQPARLHDSVELKLLPRTEGVATPPLPRDLWPDLSAITDVDERKQTLSEFIFGAWDKANTEDPKNPEPPGETPLAEDESSVFLARLVIPVEEPVGNARPARISDQEVAVNNLDRLFVYTPRALAKRIGL